MFFKAVVIVLFLLALEINSKPPELERYRGKVAMVTGASMGIGFATTIALLQAGIDVVGVARRGGYEQSITRALPIENSDNFGKFYPVQCDITDEKKLLEIFRWIDAKLGGVSIMINNAGVIERATLIGGESAAWRKVWELNVLALTVCTKAAISSMNRHMSLNGHIIHMSSIAAYSMVTAMGHKMYNASKVAVRVLADGLRHELQLYDSKIKVSVK
ncbi:farnesol dehydrogenase-like [Adelges cooleyi]|uniref:farnesol dehydrogenase-like n=1 Tax=Adelges cooleyi TaxID=133065 RepID=UPI00217F9088|nr:farnesol dehydrogenase-like [Adelges cooleyi]